MSERLPPQDRTAERAVLGSMIRDNAVIDDVARMLKPESFYFDIHQKIAGVIFDLHSNGEPADLVTVNSVIKKRGHGSDVPAAYLAEVFDASPTAANAEYYAKIVREMHSARALIHLTTELGRDAYDGHQPASQLIERAEREILALSMDHSQGEPMALHAALAEAFAKIDKRAKSPGDLFGLTTGFMDLDTLTGGLHKQELTIIAGRPGDGKTTLAVNIMAKAAESAMARVLFVSLEQSRVEIAERICCLTAKVDHFRIRSNKISAIDAQALGEASDRLSGLKITIDDSPAQTIGRIASTARRHARKHGLNLLLIDYLQLIEPEDRRVNRVEQVDDVSRRLKQLARELNIPVIAMAQLNRASEEGTGVPKLSHLRESGAIEQNADNVLMLHRPGKHDSSEEDNSIDIYIRKQRNGPTNKLTLAWLKQFLRFENYAMDPKMF